MKRLMTMALGLIAIALGAVQASAAVTAIKAVENHTSTDIYIRSYEMRFGWIIPPGGRRYEVDMWIPWAKRQSEFDAGKHISIEQPVGYCKRTIWQADWSTDGDRVRVSPCAFKIPGERIQGNSHTGGDRYLVIDQYGTPFLWEYRGLKRRKKNLRRQ